MPTRYPYDRATILLRPVTFATGASLSALTPYKREQSRTRGFLRRAVSPPPTQSSISEKPQQLGRKRRSAGWSCMTMPLSCAHSCVQPTRCRPRLYGVHCARCCSMSTRSPPRHAASPAGAVVAHATLVPPPFAVRVALGKVPCARCQAQAAQDLQQVIVLASA